MKSIAVVGAGAVGLYYGGRLALAGEDVRLLVRSDFDVLSRVGLRVESVAGDFLLGRPAVFRDAAEIGPVDLVIVAWKSTANGGLAGILPALLHDETRVLTLQNGLGNCESITAVVGDRERVLGGLCFVCLNRLSPGFVRHTAGGKVAVGAFGEDAEGWGGQVAGRMRSAGIDADFAPDLGMAQWRKLIWNVPFNGLAIAEGGVTTDVLLGSEEGEADVRSLMEEVVVAGRALGHELDDQLVDLNIERTRPMGAYRPSSMIDFVEGREVEVEAIWAEPVRRARAAGVEMPRTERLLGRIEKAIRKRDQAGS